MCVMCTATGGKVRETQNERRYNALDNALHLYNEAREEAWKCLLSRFEDFNIDVSHIKKYDIDALAAIWTELPYC